jgi:tetratricopeptide (TPR) repeat protein
MIWPFGDGPLGDWLQRRRAFQDIRRASAVDAAAISLSDSNPLYRAKVLLEIDDRAGAREFLAIARARIPDYVLTCPDTVDIMLGLGQFAELEALALKGAKRFRRNPQYLEAYALAAERQRHFEEAVRRWAVVQKKFPHSRLGYINGVVCLRELGRLAEAEALLARALRRMPDDMDVLLEAGRVANAREDWSEAYRRWHGIRERHSEGFVGAAYALHKLGRTAEAEALLADARFRHPIYRGIPVMQARIAEESGNTAEALKRWGLVRDRFPLDPAGYAEAIRLLRDLQQWAEADALALAAIDRFPAYDWPLADYAALAHVRKDWTEAAKRWAALQAAFPNRQDASQKQAEALAASVQSGG